MKRYLFFVLLFVVISIAPFANARAATVNISNNCSMEITVSAYSITTDNASYLLAKKVVNAYNSNTMSTASPVKCIKTEYPQAGHSTTANFFYFNSGANDLTVIAERPSAGSENCNISVTGK